MELKGITGVLYAMSEWIMRLSAVNLMWFVLSLPLFILLVAVDMSTPDGRVIFGVAAWVFASALFFPATATVFSVVRDWVVKNDYSSAFKKFLYHFNADFVKNVKMGAAFATVWLIWYYSYFYFYAAKSSAAFIFLMFGAALFIYTVNFLSIRAHYEMDSKECMKNAFFISAGRPLTGLYILLSSAALIWVSLFQLLWLLPFLTCSMLAFSAFSAFHRTIVKISGNPASNKAA
ncbi:DUF624 domain-containing protein [Planococcus sp. CP5-4]|uniref:YesL family protein n=1 Tax=unclassified Planococcus (in: firmicutes) TaxID=2662419 RepID=UPI001C250AAC|nr:MULTISPECIES: DUF624 domain-containing protein [unclassified Planococcus (in: firmicutes)]MBU9674067.1 DUF624 domain-containing protein [Planococcus sp. CP5-4_YE]MBV0909938.1 DUF624 domain-containing protein [Planococcus sp. CP5-4_UN]MBW6064818.1 DUF624 domain-containing protein [Planococcus sp. CP5-4]